MLACSKNQRRPYQTTMSTQFSLPKPSGNPGHLLGAGVCKASSSIAGLGTGAKHAPCCPLLLAQFRTSVCRAAAYICQASAESCGLLANSNKSEWCKREMIGALNKAGIKCPQYSASVEKSSLFTGCVVLGRVGLLEAALWALPGHKPGVCSSFSRPHTEARARETRATVSTDLPDVRVCLNSASLLFPKLSGIT